MLINIKENILNRKGGQMIAEDQIATVGYVISEALGKDSEKLSGWYEKEKILDLATEIRESDADSFDFPDERIELLKDNLANNFNLDVIDFMRKILPRKPDEA